MPTPVRDFPFQDGRPFSPTPGQWAFAFGLLAVGVAALLYGERLTGAAWPGVVLFVVLPLVGLTTLCRGRLDLVLDRPGWKDIGVGLGFGLLNIGATLLIGELVSLWLETAPNPVGGMLGGMSSDAVPAFFALTGFQLIGEELVTVIPFLAVLAVARRLGAGRSLSIGLAAVAAALFFAALHFPTYQWHVLQTVLVIGSARLVLLGAYLTTRTLWASIIAHVVNDWILFGAMILLAHARV